MTKTRPAPHYDELTPASAQASAVKRRNRAKDTAAEAMLRKALWARGLRYRLHAKDLPGKPDIIFRGVRLAVFVDGDFWHGRNWAERQRKLAGGHNAAYWLKKIGYNRERDLRNTALLEAAGWSVVRLWETDIRKRPEEAAELIAARVRQGARRGEAACAQDRDPP